MSRSTPKVLLFDIGGVCVVSPFQAILDYELEHGIPPGYVNATIQAHSPNGAWQQVERGEIVLNDAFFQQFTDELNDPGMWKPFCERLAKKDPTVIQKLIEKDGASEQDKSLPKQFGIDGKVMFWNMMRMSRRPDPYMYPALQTLRRSGRFVLAALSNTIAFPEGVTDEKGTEFKNGLHTAEGKYVGNIHEQFDVFVSSAHVGLRKPDPRIYELAVSEAQKVADKKGLGQVTMKDTLFLDDIGGNLKPARQLGMDTIKVNLGKSKTAVQELERKTGLKLIDESSKL